MKQIIALILAFCFFITQSVSLAEDDPDLLEYATLREPSEFDQIEDVVQHQFSDTLGDEYRVDVQVYYESKEAIEEGRYNSKETEYFGFYLSDVDAHFQGTPYVFTVGDAGETTVTEFVAYKNPWGTILKNALIGTGIIIVCVTVSHLTIASAPALHLIFACSAETAKSWAIRGAGIGALKSGIISFLQTGDLKTAFMDAVYGASEGYKWGAIGGAVTGGTATAINLNNIRRASGLTMNEVATIKQSGLFSDATIKKIHSMDEYNLYKDASFTEYQYNGRTFLLPKDFDKNYIDPSTGKTNLQLIGDGYNPVYGNGTKYDIHHVGQRTDSPLALLTKEQHHNSFLHPIKISEVRPAGNTSIWAQDKKNALESLFGLLNTI